MIDVRRLRVLRALADHGTVAAAAQALHLTPSAVSQQLATLEREVGQPVVERRGRGLVLTGAADVLLDHAHALFAQLERAEADVAAHARGELGTVVVGAFPTALASIAAPAAQALAVTQPRLGLELLDVESPHCFAALAEEAIDVAISMQSASAPTPGDPRFASRPLLDDPLDAVLPAGHPLAGARRSRSRRSPMSNGWAPARRRRAWRSRSPAAPPQASRRSSCTARTTSRPS